MPWVNRPASNTSSGGIRLVYFLSPNNNSAMFVLKMMIVSIATVVVITMAVNAILRYLLLCCCEFGFIAMNLDRPFPNPPRNSRGINSPIAFLMREYSPTPSGPNWFATSLYIAKKQASKNTWVKSVRSVSLKIGFNLSLI